MGFKGQYLLEEVEVSSYLQFHFYKQKTITSDCPLKISGLLLVNVNRGAAALEVSWQVPEWKEVLV